MHLSPEDHEMEFEPGPPNPEDCCAVCGQIECGCPPEDEEIKPVNGLLNLLKRFERKI